MLPLKTKVKNLYIDATFENKNAVDKATYLAISASQRSQVFEYMKYLTYPAVFPDGPWKTDMDFQEVSQIDCLQFGRRGKMESLGVLNDMHICPPVKNSVQISGISWHYHVSNSKVIKFSL